MEEWTKEQKGSLNSGNSRAEWQTVRYLGRGGSVLLRVFAHHFFPLADVTQALLLLCKKNPLHLQKIEGEREG